MAAVPGRMMPWDEEPTNPASKSAPGTVGYPQPGTSPHFGSCPLWPWDFFFFGRWGCLVSAPPPRSPRASPPGHVFQPLLRAPGPPRPPGGGLFLTFSMDFSTAKLYVTLLRVWN